MTSETKSRTWLVQFQTIGEVIDGDYASPLRCQKGGEFRCRKCPPCKAVKQRLTVGRALAEAYASQVFFLTLTFDEDHIGKGLFDRRTIHVWIKRLKRAGLRFKYICAMEHGDKTGREHFHVLLFVDEHGPDFDIPIGSFLIDEKVTRWPYGHVDCRVARPVISAVIYTCKYINKDGADVFMSNGFGKQYLENHVEMLARHREPLPGRMPNGHPRKSGVTFTVPGVRQPLKKTRAPNQPFKKREQKPTQLMPVGKVFRYHLPSGHSWIETLVRLYIAEWQKTWGEDPPLDFVGNQSGDW